MKDNDHIIIHGKTLTCSHCGCTGFTSHTVTLRTPFIDFALLGRWPKIFECEDCGHIEWFFHTREPDATIGLNQESQCLSCGEPIPPQKTSCPKCGWTYT